MRLIKVARPPPAPPEGDRADTSPDDALLAMSLPQLQARMAALPLDGRAGFYAALVRAYEASPAPHADAVRQDALRNLSGALRPADLTLIDGLNRQEEPPQEHAVATPPGGLGWLQAEAPVLPAGPAAQDGAEILRMINHLRDDQLCFMPLPRLRLLTQGLRPGERDAVRNALLNRIEAMPLRPDQLLGMVVKLRDL